jgi:5-dehydro-2-deoxygluconokinase
MNTEKIGYNQPLYIMAFDHRGSFAKKVLGWTKEELSKDELHQMQPFKQIIYDAIKQLISDKKILAEEIGILVDEETGDSILRDATAQGIRTILTVEKSGQEEFQFEYGDGFREHIKTYGPTFAKVLIRYNPEGDAEVNERQKHRLKILSDYCKESGVKFMIETLIPATQEEMIEVDGDKQAYDKTLRPLLEVRMIADLQAAGIEADVWKLEGLEKQADYEAIVEQARFDGRDDVSVVVLGREATFDQVDEWLNVGAKVHGVTGFAIGRTIFEAPLSKFVQKIITRDEAQKLIADNFLHFYNVFKLAKEVKSN